MCSEFFTRVISILLLLNELSSFIIVAESWPTLCNPMDCSPPGSSVHGIFSGKNTGEGCYFLLQEISQPRDQTWVSWNGRQILYHGATREVPLLLNPYYNRWGKWGLQKSSHSGFWQGKNDLLTGLNKWNFSLASFIRLCKSWLIGKDLGAWKDWGQEEKQMIENELVGWMASLTQQTWVWVSSGRWRRTGKSSVLQSMGLKRVRQDVATEQQQHNCGQSWKRSTREPEELEPWEMSTAKILAPQQRRGDQLVPSDLPSLPIG